MAPEEDKESETAAQDKRDKVERDNKSVVPDSWSLTKQQKAFIDSFSQDDADNND